MDKVRPLFAGFAAVLLVIFPPQRSLLCMAEDTKSSCSPSSCGKIPIIRPFRLIGDPENCGDKRYELSCVNNLTVLNLFSGKYYVQVINYNNYTIRLVDPGIQKDNCTSMPSYSLAEYNFRNFSYNDAYKTFFARVKKTKRSLFGWKHSKSVVYLSKSVVFLNCVNSMSSSSYVATAPCTMAANTSGVVHSKQHSYVHIDYLNSTELATSCQIQQMALIAQNGTENTKMNMSYADVHGQMAHGFELSWLSSQEKGTEMFCRLDESDRPRCVAWCDLYGLGLQSDCGIKNKIIIYIQIHYRQAWLITGLLIGPRVLLGTLLFLLLIYRWRRRHLSMYDTIEDFLQHNNNLMPIRYSYSEIKKMTRGFEDKLGEGGYGFVFKGKLRSGRFVAIKMLGKSNANGQEFINEVATIGRIHHANVVQLIGFCVEGSKRALVYEFMSNGSLDKYIFSKEGSAILSHEQMLEISLGVACGIEYLHQGCNMQILHFDIKPHNILLDENFKPKVSDFGLAKLNPIDNSIVSLTAIRGTIGYMAPELFYKNIGGVSYKADVYSFGMLLMEIMGKRKNCNAPMGHSNETYFPDWVYDQVSKENEVDLEISLEKDRKLEKKIIIVALWCIQMRPSDRPSMRRVIEMLEGEVESLQLPPRPFLFPQDMHTEDYGDAANSAWSSVLSGDPLESNPLLSLNSNKVT